MTSQSKNDIVQQMRDIAEIDIETTSRKNGKPRRTTIWVVVVDGQIYVRSVKGIDGIWYQELIAQPTGAIHANNRRIPVQAIHVTDDRVNARVSEEYLRKYRGDPWAPPMAVPEVLPATFRLEPISDN